MVVPTKHINRKPILLNMHQKNISAVGQPKSNHMVCSVDWKALFYKHASPMSEYLGYDYEDEVSAENTRLAFWESA